jgi:glucose/arabinose dehydrogenase
MRPLLILACLVATVSFAAVPPATPVITEPDADDRAFSAADVHMATAPFHDDDGDAHRCSDWEIRENTDVVWSAPCATGSNKIHIHLGDGTFAGSRTSLSDATSYVLRVRHRDASGLAAAEWSAWSERRFRTTPAAPAPAFVARDFLDDPAPRWTRSDGQPVELPLGAVLRLEAADGERLLEFRESEVFNAPSFAEKVAVRAVLTAEQTTWIVPESTLTLYDHEGVEHTIFFAPAFLPSSVSLHLWISANGSTHYGEAAERAPDFARIARGAAVPWTTAHKGFRVERVAGDLQLPVNIAFVPQPGDAPDSPLFYVTELYGGVKVVTRSGEVRDFAKSLLNFYPSGAFPGDGETGLTGIAVEPESGDVYVASLYFRAGWTYPHIVRLESDDGGLTAARVTTVLDMPDEQQAPSHQISNVSIGPDGKLYFHMGDTHHAPHAQDLNTMRGKILRMNLDGSAPTDNPFYDASNGIAAADYVFALGFRNPFGGAWRAADGMLYEVENGPTIDRFARVDRGFNYGWNDSDASMLIGSICGFPQGAAPVNVAFVQSETFGGSGFPSSKRDRAFVSESGPTWGSGTPTAGKRISEIAVKMDGTLESGPDTFVRYNGSGKATVTGIAAGPDGLYFTTLYKDFGYVTPTDRGAEVFRVRWTGYADFVLRTDDNDPLRVELLDRSDVADAASWLWDFGDGSTSIERNPTHPYARAGSYLVTLRVTGASEPVVVRKHIHLSSGGAGLRADYFPTVDWSGSGTRRVDRVIDWNALEPLPFAANAFSVRWTGRLLPRVSEPHRFIAESSGDVRISIDGHVVTNAVDLEAGRMYDITVEFVHRGGATPQMRLLWEADSQPRDVVPWSVFFGPELVRRRPTRS